MITRTEADQLAAAVHRLRPDWPEAQLVTLIGEHRDWSLREFAVALVWVALDQDTDGRPLSRSPYRVREQGPWNLSGVDPEAEKARQRAERERADRMADIRARAQATAACQTCDEHGRLTNGVLCDHTDLGKRRDLTAAYREAARAAAAEARKRHQAEEVA